MLTTFAIATWLGILTSISPCPLATNIAAVSFLARRMHSRRLAVAGAVAYAAGRAIVYLVIGALVAWGLTAAPSVSHFLQQTVAPFIGPLLIVVALILMGWISLPINIGLHDQGVATRLAKLGLMGEFLLGMVFALTFCPVSAALFFGTLLPLAIASDAVLSTVAIYGIGTALPVGVVAVLIALGANISGTVIHAIQRWQGTIRILTSVAILLVGVWLTLGLLLSVNPGQ